MGLAYITLALITLSVLLYYYLTRSFNFWKNKGVAGPKPVPFFGNIKEGVLRRRNYGLILKEVYDAFPEEKIVGIYRMTTPCLLIRDLDIIKNVMIKDFDLFVDRGISYSKESLGSNMFHADSDTWRVLRSRLAPIFSTSKLKNMMHLMTKRADAFTKYVEEICTEKSEHEMHALMQRFTMANISACAFGLDFDTQHNQKTIETLQKVDKSMFDLNCNFEIDMMYPGILKRLNISLFPKFVRAFFDGLVKDILSERNGLPTGNRDLMDLILELRQQGEIYGTKGNGAEKQISLELTDELIVAQAFVFYAAGYETSATTMAYFLYELAKNPNIQDKLIAHIDEVLIQHNGEVTYETLQDMTYLGKVFDETLRKYPLVEPLQRKTKADYKVPGTNVTIPKDTILLVSATGIQHDPKYYPDPEKFDPERHSPENLKEMHPCAYLPFGVGPRQCIGTRFGKIQTRVCMIKLLSKFRVQMSKNTPEKVEMCPKRAITGPHGGIHLNLVRR